MPPPSTGSKAWSSRRRGPTCGSAPMPAATSRRRGWTPGGGASTGTTTCGGSGGGRGRGRPNRGFPPAPPTPPPSPPGTPPGGGERRDREKFDHMLDFARALPKLRHYAREHLAEEGLTRERVLACAARLLDLGFFRIGTEGYAEENQTYGLATIHKRHVKLEAPSTVNFDYMAKGSKRRIQSVVDPDVYA